MTIASTVMHDWPPKVLVRQGNADPAHGKYAWTDAYTAAMPVGTWFVVGEDIHNVPIAAGAVWVTTAGQRYTSGAAAGTLSAGIFAEKTGLFEVTERIRPLQVVLAEWKGSSSYNIVVVPPTGYNRIQVTWEWAGQVPKFFASGTGNVVSVAAQRTKHDGSTTYQHANRQSMQDLSAGMGRCTGAISLFLHKTNNNRWHGSYTGYITMDVGGNEHDMGADYYSLSGRIVLENSGGFTLAGDGGTYSAVVTADWVI